jgi:hypothetical protein
MQKRAGNKGCLGGRSNQPLLLRTCGGTCETFLSAFRGSQRFRNALAISKPRSVSGISRKGFQQRPQGCSHGSNLRRAIQDVQKAVPKSTCLEKERELVVGDESRTW